MGREEQKLRTRQIILEEAMTLFAKQGILATKTIEVAKAAHISHGAIFVHFPTKNDLLIAVIDEFGRRLSQEFDAIEIQHLTMKKILQAHLKVIAQDEALYARLITEAPLLPSEVRSVLFMLQSGISYSIHRIAKKEMRTGKIRSLAPHLLFNSWISLIYYYLANRDIFAPGDSVIKVKGTELIHHFLKLIEEKYHD